MSPSSLSSRVYRRCRWWWRSRFGAIPSPEKWVFITGCYNSGTTLLHDLVAMHPDVGSLPREGQFLTDQLTTPMEVGLPRLWADEPSAFYLDESGDRGVDVVRLKRQWGLHFDDPEQPVLLEKTPTNAARLRWLDHHFERATFLGIVRDGYAVAEGIHRKAGHPVGLAARQWSRSNEIMLEDFEHLERKLLIRYEDLTADPTSVMDEIWGLLDLDPPEKDLTDRRWEVHQRTSTIRNLNPASHEALTHEDRREIEVEAGSMLSRLGYSAPSRRGRERTES